MRLESITLTNFRCFKNEEISLAPYTAIVGPNNSGKSTIFRAIDLFFRTNQRTTPLSVSDFNDTSRELRISLAFADLPVEALPGFEHYQRHGKLEFFVKGEVIEGSVRASIHGKRRGIADFGGFFSGAAADRKQFYNGLRTGAYKDLPAISLRNAVGVFEQALLTYEAAHPEKQEPIESEDLAFGATGVVSRLRRYIDWVYIPAVKDASDEDEEARNTAFGVLVNRLVRARVSVDEKIEEIQRIAKEKVQELAKGYRSEIRALESALDEEFRRMTSVT